MLVWDIFIIEQCIKDMLARRQKQVQKTSARLYIGSPGKLPLYPIK